MIDFCTKKMYNILCVAISMYNHAVILKKEGTAYMKDGLP